MVWTDLHQELYLIVSELLNEGKIFRNDIEKIEKTIHSIICENDACGHIDLSTFDTKKKFLNKYRRIS